MKKILIALMLLGSLSYFAINAATVTTNNTTESITSANKEYEAVATVKGYSYEPYRVQHWWYFSKTLYSGVNTCNAYYFESKGYYYPVKKNTYKTYKDHDVSEYEWICTIGSETYFFSY